MVPEPELRPLLEGAEENEEEPDSPLIFREG
jgi:hypothetical protein